jgi:hypothetical protein
VAVVSKTDGSPIVASVVGIEAAVVHCQLRARVARDKSRYNNQGMQQHPSNTYMAWVAGLKSGPYKSHNTLAGNCSSHIKYCCDLHRAPVAACNIYVGIVNVVGACIITCASS